jgi:hypothetical protein
MAIFSAIRTRISREDGGWWLVAGEWLLNLQFGFNDPMNQEELGT